MEVQVEFVNLSKLYSYDCINGGKVGDCVIILEGRLTGNKATIRIIGRGSYNGKLYQCWRPEFDESLIEEWCKNADMDNPDNNRINIPDSTRVMRIH